MKFLLLLLTLITFESFAQDDPFEIVTKDSSKTKKRESSQSKVQYSGRLELSNLLFSSSTTRTITQAGLRAWRKKDTWGFEFDGEYYNAEVTHEASLRPGNSDPTLSPTRKIEIKNSEFLLNDFNLSLFPSDKLSLKVGRQKIVWGQFDLLSPVDFMLPIKFNSIQVIPTKLQRRYPLNSLTVSYFPSSKVEFTGYFLPKYEKIDAAIETAQSFGNTYEVPQSGATVTFASETTPLILPESSKTQSALRLMFYLDWATFGFTYFKGYDYFIEDKKYLDTANITIGGTPTPTNYTRKEKFVPKRDAIGFEISKPSGSWIWKGEFLYEKGINASLFAPFSAELGSTPADYISWVQNNNNNSFNVEVDRIFSAIGFSFQGEKWSTDFALYLYNEIFSDEAKEGLELSNQASILASREEYESSFVFPGFNISRKYGSQSGKFGFAAGALGANIGASFYVTNNFKETLDWSIAYQYLQPFGSDGSDDDPDYERDSDSISGLNLTLSYRF